MGWFGSIFNELIKQQKQYIEKLQYELEKEIERSRRLEVDLDNAKYDLGALKEKLLKKVLEEDVKAVHNINELKVGSLLLIAVEGDIAYNNGIPYNRAVVSIGEKYTIV